MWAAEHTRCYSFEKCDDVEMGTNFQWQVYQYESDVTSTPQPHPPSITDVNQTGFAFMDACSENDSTMRQIGKQVGLARAFVVRKGQLKGHEMPGGKDNAKTPGQCKYLCDKTSGCVSWNWIHNGIKVHTAGSQGQCILNSAEPCDHQADFVSDNPNAYLYLKQLC